MQSKDLYDLIHSLSKSEKRHIKLVAKIQQGSKKYIHLFDLFNNQVDFDEKKLLEQFVDAKIQKNFFMAKKRLYEKIMHSLRIINATKTTKSQAVEMIANVKILEERGLRIFYRKELEVALKFVKKHNLIFEKLQILEEYISVKKDELSIEKQADSVLESYDLVNNELDVLKERIEYWKISNLLWINRLLYQKSKNETYRKEVSNLINSFLEKDEADLKSLEAKGLYYELKVRMLWGENDIDAFIAVAFKILNVTLLSKRTTENCIDGIRAYGTIVLGYILKGKNEEAMVVLKEKDDFKESVGRVTESITLNDLETDGIYKLFLLYKTGHSEEFKTVNKIETFLETKSHMAAKNADLYTIKLNIAFYYLVNGRDRKASFWINDVLSTKIDYQPVIIHSQILYLMLQYEMANNEIAEYLLRNYERSHKKENSYKGVFEIIFISFKKILNYPFLSPKAVPIFKELRNQIKNREVSLSEKRILTFVDFDAWCESKAQQLSFKDYVSKKRQV